MSHNYTQDFYAKKAKSEGYVARSIYKLEEIHKKYLTVPNTLKRAKNILDIGAAPGSWVQYLHRHAHNVEKIVSVDMLPLKIPKDIIPCLTHIQEDITNPSVIKKLIALGPFDLILSDVAPHTTGHKHIDTAQSELLVDTVVHIASHALVRGGYLIAKIFQGAGTHQFTQSLRSQFKHVSLYKPKAVRASSFEIYVICCGIFSNQ